MPGTRKLGKTTDQRRAMLRQQVTDFLDNGKMETTITRAKEIKPVAQIVSELVSDFDATVRGLKFKFEI